MFFSRTLLEPLASAVSAGKVRLLFGARQTGKTELLRQVVTGAASAVFNLQESTLRRRLRKIPAASVARSGRSPRRPDTF